MFGPRVNVFNFFFSSRRRHTRWPRDWSSDVCSSDLSWLSAPPKGPVPNSTLTGDHVTPAGVVAPIDQEQGGAKIPASGEAGPAGLENEVPRSTQSAGARTAAPDDIQSLWGLVETGDTRAEVTLADHYSQGTGVPQNCTQARVLLTAAVRRGNIQAKRKLDELP